MNSEFFKTSYYLYIDREKKMGVTPDRNREIGKGGNIQKWRKVAGAEGLRGLKDKIKNKIYKGILKKSLRIIWKY